MVIGAEIQYRAADGVKNLTWKFDLENAVENAALVLKFDKGASVQVDNVSMIGASQGEEADETPLTTASSWSTDSGNESAAPAMTKDGDVYTVTGAISDDKEWYTPQIISENYSLVSGKSYKFSAKFKLEGIHNNTLQYIIQENSGSWYVYNGGPTTITYDPATADADGFCTYEVEFTADMSLSTVHKVIKTEPVLYTVVRGDNLSKIAKRFGISLSELIAMNPQIRNPNLIFPGQILVVSEGTVVTDGDDAADTWYEVVRGDCLYTIARKHKLTLNELYALNSAYIGRKYIYAGQKIRVK